jgi:hypothetical protein
MAHDPHMAWTIEATGTSTAAPSAVFALYADPETWTSWGHNATRARARGPMEVGGIVEVRANYAKVYPCVIRRFDRDRALDLEVRPPGMTILNVYEVEPGAGGGSRIRHAFEISGPMGAFGRLVGLGRVYRRKLEAEVAAVARMAEGDTAAGSGATDITPVEKALHGAERRVGAGTWED